MFEVSVEKTFAAAHRLFDYDGPCEALHGHNYRVQIFYTGTELDRFGMLVDFTDIKRVFNTVLDTVDHTYLNDLPEFAGISPSAENIAAYIFHAMKASPFERATLRRVSVWETPTQVATIEHIIEDDTLSDSAVLRARCERMEKEIAELKRLIRG